MRGRRIELGVVLSLIVLVGAAPTGSTTGGSSAGGAGTRQIVWVSVEDAQRVAKVDLVGGHVLRRFEVPGRPHNITVNRAGTVAAALWNAGRIAVIRRGLLEVVYLGGAPHDVKMGGGRIVVANQGAARLDLVSFRGEPRRRIGLKANPHDVAVGPRGHIAWATLEGSDDIAVVNLDKKRVRRYLSTGKSPHDLLFSPDGRIWVTDWNGAVHVFSRRGRLLMSRSLGVEAHHLAFTPDGDQVWITDHEAHKVFVLGTRRMRVLERIGIRGAPHHVSVTPDGTRAVVADHERGLLVVYRISTRNRIDKIAVGPGPHGVWSKP